MGDVMGNDGFNFCQENADGTFAKGQTAIDIDWIGVKNAIACVEEEYKEWCMAMATISFKAMAAKSELFALNKALIHLENSLYTVLKKK